MDKGELFEIGGDVLPYVIHALNYPSEKALKQDVEIIKEWMETQKHLPEIMDDKKIQNFLILNKGSIERTKEKLDMYYTIRSLLPDIFDEINPKLPYWQEALDTYYLVPLPKLTKEKYRVCFYKAKNANLMAKLDPISGIRNLINLQEIRLSEDITYGDVFIFDGKDTPANLVLKLTPNMIYKALNLIYKRVYSNRLKGVYIINAPPLAEIFMKILKTTMKPKLLDRIHLCPDENFLVEKFSKKIIPKDYGGEEKSLEEIQQLVREKFVQNAERCDELDMLRVNEDLRSKSLENDEILGYYGSFKKLEID